MRVHEGTLYLSATDVANHLSCPHLTTLDVQLARGEVAEPTWQNPHAKVLRARGLEHEKAYLDRLRIQGIAIIDLTNSRI